MVRKKNRSAVELGRRGGLAGGRARAERLSPRERSAIARRAAASRWQRESEERPAFARDAEATRRRIIDAAIGEFAQHGPDRARLDRIARRAGVNRRLVHDYFGGKEALFRTLFERNLLRIAEIESRAPQTLGDAFVYWQEALIERRSWLRLQLWEALAFTGQPTPALHRRREFWRAASRELEPLAATLGVDAEYLQLAIVAIVLFPLFSPQTTEVITGALPGSAAFAEGQSAFLRAFAAMLEAQPRTRRTTATKRGSARSGSKRGSVPR